MLKITGIHLKFVYLIKLLSNRYATLIRENLENTSNLEGWGLILVANKKGAEFEPKAHYFKRLSYFIRIDLYTN